MLLTVQACVSRVGAGLADPALPRLLVAAPGTRGGGQARFEGTVEIDNGCVLVASQGRTALPIFDSSVRLADGGDALLDEATGRRLSFGAAFIAGGAWLRDSGSGWPFEDIEEFFGVDLPPECGGDTIVRLKRFEPVGM